ncbi:hypothetical protein [Roseovarius nanhaiticus]|uniref:hypothetical protein n=1 Tax=Roseovarius nanhaiticus TaxID=573024 RepID=UPI00249021E0|nr:hypothetical protein [Roseovarius nanhaiticus]
MTRHPTSEEMPISMVAYAIRKARLANEMVISVVVPLLPPLRRGIAEDIGRRLDGNHFISEAFLRDLTALIDFLAREIAHGTQCAWVADEHDVSGGHDVMHRDDRALALSKASIDLVYLHNAIADVLDFEKAERIAGAVIRE